MNRTESTSSQHSYVLEVGVIIGGVFSEAAFRHDCRIVTLGVVIVGTEQTGHRGARRKNALQSSEILMTKRPAPPRTLISRNASMANPLNCSPIFKDSLALGTCLG
jgi:hypothetical protein